MSPRTFVTRGASLFALAILGLAACESKTILPPNNPDVVVVVTPSTAALTKAGQTATYVALVTGVGTNGNTAVTWKVAPATGVVSLAATGNSATVTATGPGQATVIATSVQDPTRSGAATVNVTITTDTGKVAPPTVSIASITDNNGHNVDINNVQGAINVTLNVDVPTGNQISSVNWLIDGKTVCSQTFTQGKSAGDATTQAADAVTMSCQINTASLTNGVPTFANGSHTLSATLVGPGGTTQASTSQSLVFNNGNSVGASFTTTKNAIGANGFVWNGGNLTVTAAPVIFTGSAIARTTFTAILQGAASSRTVVDSTAADGFTATFRGDTTGGFLTGITDSVKVVISTVTAAGTQGPVDTLNVGRFDNQAPAKVMFYLKDFDQWKNGTFAFSSAIDTTVNADSTARPGPVDIGVDRVTYTFSAGPTRDSLTTVTTGNDLAETTTNTRYVIKVVLADALGNSATVWGAVKVINDTTGPNGRFGIDKQAPVIDFAPASVIPGRVAGDTSFTSDPTLAVNKDFAVEYQDVGASGFASAKPVKVIVVRYDTVSTNNDCLVGSGGTTVAKCTKPDSTNSLTPVQNTEGYQVITAYVTDQAGNQSPVISERVLVDLTAPTTSGFQGPSTLKGGAAATFTDTAYDNLDLGAFKARIKYGALLSLPAGSGTLGTYGQDALTTSAAITASTTSFIRSIQDGVAGIVYPADNITFIVNDVAGNVNAVQDNAITSPAATAFPALNSWAMSSAATDPTTLEATLKVDTTVIKTPPFTSVAFYKLSGGVATQIAVANAPLISDVGTIRNFRYAVAAPTLKDGDTIFAMGVTSNGDALKTANQAITITP